MKRFWTPGSILFLVVFFTVASMAANGIPATACLYIIFLGMFITYKILAKENL